MSKTLENAILRNLEKIRDLSSEGDKEAQMNSKQEVDSKDFKDDPDELIKTLPKMENFVGSAFNFESRKQFLDEIYFKNSKLIKM